MDWIKTAKVGDNVVCVDGAWSPRQRRAADRQGLPLPEEGGIYTIRTIGVVIPGRVHVRLEELINPILDYAFKGPIEQAFDHVMFRPVQPRKTDISIFTRLLNTTPVREDA
jgi:hypothetical protein